MPSFSEYKSMLQAGGKSVGDHRWYDSQRIIENTWDGDPNVTVAYFYSYDNDDESHLRNDLHPYKSKTKIPVEIKYIYEKYQSIDSDTTDVRIMFKPGYKCTVPYYHEKFEIPTYSTFPCGLYCDIYDKPTEQWNRWLVIAPSDNNNQDFPTFSILPCTYKFQWIENGIKREVWGVEREQSSYNSGLWHDKKFETVENQKKAFMPYNEISKNLFYNYRIIISADLPEPITWRVSKVEPLAFKGCLLFTFAQTHFNMDLDYIERDKSGSVIGMWADFFKTGNVPQNVPSVSSIYSVITYTGAKPVVKIGGSYKTITVEYYNSGEKAIDQTPGEWSFWIDDVDISELIEIKETEKANTIKIKFLGDEHYNENRIIVKNDRDGVIAKLNLEITSL